MPAHLLVAITTRGGQTPRGRASSAKLQNPTQLVKRGNTRTSTAAVDGRHCNNRSAASPAGGLLALFIHACLQLPVIYNVIRTRCTGLNVSEADTPPPPVHKTRRFTAFCYFNTRINMDRITSSEPCAPPPLTGWKPEKERNNCRMLQPANGH